MIIVVRHGERADLDEEESKTVENKHDPHLTMKGKAHAEETGLHIKELLLKNNQSSS